MSTLAEVEAAVAAFSPEELAELERFVRTTKQTKSAKAQHSVFDIKPSQLGQMLRPLGTREEWYDEMLEGRVGFTRFDGHLGEAGRMGVV